MADASTAQECSKVTCCSRNSAKQIIDIIENKITETIDVSDVGSNEQKIESKKRFCEIFKTAFQLNLQIGGQSWEDAENENDATSEYEPLDVEKKNFINDKLLTSLDEAVVKTARYRKTTGKRYKCKQKKLVASESEYLSQVKVQCDDLVLEPSQTTSCEFDKTTTDRLAQACVVLSDLTKTTEELMQKFDNLHKAAEINKIGKKFRTDNVVFKPSTDDGKMAESITPLKRKLRGSDSLTPAKRRYSNRWTDAQSPLKSLNHTPNKIVTVEKRHSPRLASKFTTNHIRLKS